MLQIPEIVDFIGVERKRPFREGEALLRAGHLFAVVNVSESADFPIINAYCLQSTISEPPHKIEIRFETVIEEVGYL